MYNITRKQRKSRGYRIDFKKNIRSKSLPLTFRARGCIFISGHLYCLCPAAFRIWAKSDWKGFRWLRFQAATLQIFLHRLFAHLLKIHPEQSIEVPSETRCGGFSTACGAFLERFSPGFAFTAGRGFFFPLRRRLFPLVAEKNGEKRGKSGKKRKIRLTIGANRCKLKAERTGPEVRSAQRTIRTKEVSYGHYRKRSSL